MERIRHIDDKGVELAQPRAFPFVFRKTITSFDIAGMGPPDPTHPRAS